VSYPNGQPPPHVIAGSRSESPLPGGKYNLISQTLHCNTFTKMFRTILDR